MFYLEIVMFCGAPPDTHDGLLTRALFSTIGFSCVDKAATAVACDPGYFSLLGEKLCQVSAL